MEELQDFNKSRIDILFGNNGDICRQVLEILKTDLPKHLEVLSASIEQKDSRQIYETAHTLKGSLANVGADLGSSLAQQMLLAAKEKNFDYCRRIYDALHQSTQRFLAAFEELALEDT